MQPIDITQQRHGAAAIAFAKSFDQVNQLNEAHPTKNYYYTYGWWGLLSRSARYADAKKLIRELEPELKKYYAQGIYPKIRMLGFSHGGTVILKMALVKEQEKIVPSFAVDEVILLGTPIQYETDYLINDPLFKKVYNIYSPGDRITKIRLLFSR